MKQEDTKQRILEKSLELFASKGYDAVSVRENCKGRWRQGTLALQPLCQQTGHF